MRLPHWTFYVETLPRGLAGAANGPIIRILRAYRDDAGLWRHEYEHVRQFYLTLGMHPMLYKFVRRYRAWAEAHAFARQAKPDFSDLHVMARRMASGYDLRLSPEECAAMIRSVMERLR
jgi:hypothetical protein